MFSINIQQKGNVVETASFIRTSWPDRYERAAFCRPVRSKGEVKVANKAQKNVLARM